MRVAILTSSRADYGIYQPLLRRMKDDPFFDFGIIAFGTHLSQLHGHTVDNIVKDGYKIDYTIDHVTSEDSPKAISTSMAMASLKLAEIWDREKENYDLVFCLGDRYEMFAAVSSAVPFNIKFAHIHGGETTLGAIDNKFRHCLSLFSDIHFVSTRQYAERVAQITGSPENIYDIGALSLDNLEEIALLSREQFLSQYKIDLDRGAILVTFHPETIKPGDNEKNVQELLRALATFNGYQIIITMPNADTMGNMMRQKYKEFAQSHANVHLVENFGTSGYFSCMKYCSVVVGNSSSGIIEAASFQKHVVDIGRRQLGRITSGNVFHSGSDSESIVRAVNTALSAGPFLGDNIYFKKGAANAIIKILKN